MSVCLLYICSERTAFVAKHCLVDGHALVVLLPRVSTLGQNFDKNQTTCDRQALVALHRAGFPVSVLD